jgi:SpoVK/Ycf46/Vps4 family AAA+-type ATPase
LKARKIKMQHFEDARNKIHPTCTKDVVEFFDTYEAKVLALRKKNIGMFS